MKKMLILKLETEYLQWEKRRLEMSFWFGENPNYIKTFEEFFNEMYKN